MYARASYITAVGIVELPYLIAQTIVFVPISYFMIGESATSAWRLTTASLVFAAISSGNEHHLASEGLLERLSFLRHQVTLPQKLESQRELHVTVIILTSTCDGPQP